jgi:Mn2+/Fe2+ NRAMP family transporter
MEFLILLVVTLLISIVTAFLVIFFFRKPIDKIFHRILGDEIATAWRKFLTFALFVVGVSSGVNLYKLEQFVQPETENLARPILTPEYWGLEVYRTIIGTLGGMAWALLIFFIVALIAFVIVRGREMKQAA